MDDLLDLMYEKANLCSLEISEEEQKLINCVKEVCLKDYLALEDIRYSVHTDAVETAYKHGVIDGIRLIRKILLA